MMHHVFSVTHKVYHVRFMEGLIQSKTKWVTGTTTDSSTFDANGMKSNLVSGFFHTRTCSY